MPATTPLGIRYPLLTEVVNVTDWQNMASDIDALLSQVDALKDTARVPPYGEAYAAGVTATVNVTTTVNFTSGETNAGIMDLGTFPDRFTLGTGLWFIVNRIDLISMTTITSIRLSFTVNGTLHTAHKVPTILNTQAAVTNVGLVVALTAGTILRTQVLWTGTGGPATGNARMSALKIRDL